MSHHESHHSHDGNHGEGHGDREMFTSEFWDERYAGAPQVWSGRPNQRLVEQVAQLRPDGGGRALDVGCGEGADAVWLAGQGWTVTGVDVSQVALGRAAAHAADAGVADRTTWAQVDLLAGTALPEGFDLVCASYVHVPPADLLAVYGRIAASVRPGGTLFVVGHHPDDRATGVREERFAHLLMPPEAIVAALDPATWTVEVSAGQTRDHEHDGVTRTLTDTVVVARRA